MLRECDHNFTNWPFLWWPFLNIPFRWYARQAKLLGVFFVTLSIVEIRNFKVPDKEHCLFFPKQSWKGKNHKNWNPLPLDNEACALPLCHNHGPNVKYFLFQILFSNDQLQQQIAGLVISQQESAHYTEQLNAKIQVTLSDLSSIGTMYP